MTLIEEVLGFSRDFINNRSARTKERKEKIRNALGSLTGEFINFGCSTCYVEALFKIKNLTIMASSKYELKRGVVLQAFGDASKTCTNDTITDELGDWYMKHYPEKAIYFARMPVPGTINAPANIVIVPAAKKEPSVKEEPTVDDITDSLMNEAMDPTKVKVQRSRKTKK
jgi:hypothetical protein